MWRSFLRWVLLLMLPLAARAQFTYATNNGAITITGFDCASAGGVVNIPGSIAGKPVVAIGDYAFGGCTNVTSVLIPSSVTSIGDSAFTYCPNLTNVTIGAGVASIGEHAFYACASLAAISVDAHSSHFRSVDGVLFNQSQRTLIQYPQGKSGGYAIPAGVTTVGSEAFFNCTSLTNLTLPATLTVIQYQAFASCSNLTDMAVPNRVTAMEDSAFAGCTKLASLTITNGVTVVGNNAFGGCSALTNLVLPDSVTSFGRSPFLNCSRLANVKIGSGITNQLESGFDECQSLVAFEVSEFNPVYSSSDGVLFNRVSNMLLRHPRNKAGNFTIPEGVVFISGAAFAYCTKLTGVVIPDSVRNIGVGAFFGCVNLTNVAVGNGVNGIGGAAFMNCQGITEITLPKTLASLGQQAFAQCSNLKVVKFQGNAPRFDWGVYGDSYEVVSYFLSGTDGWGNSSTGRPLLAWKPAISAIEPAFGVRTNQFGFNINWASDKVVVIEAATKSVNPTWRPVSTNTLTGGTAYFSDPDWTNYPSRVYRIRAQ